MVKAVRRLCVGWVKLIRVGLACGFSPENFGGLFAG
jgi:hypothetical protein